MVGFSLFKLWLVRGQKLQAIGGSIHDDQHYLTQAESLLQLDWLGPFNSLTLIKGPFFPIWIAGCFRLGIPLLLAQHLLYIAAVFLLVHALRRWIYSRGVRLIFFAWLLFNPSTFQVLRVLRDGIYCSEILLIIACAVGLSASWNAPLKRAYAWGTGLGLSLVAFWLTREEGVWFVPSVALLIGTATRMVWKHAAEQRRWRLTACALPLLIWGAGLLTVSMVNWIQYGMFTVVELKSPAFVRAYAALVRVKPAEFRRYLPVPKETRERIYEVSPAFAELRPYLEGRLGQDWASYSQYFTGLDPASNEIASTWFLFALRDAVEQAGYYTNSFTAMNFYKRLALEINSACEEGRLQNWPLRLTLLPRWQREYHGMAWTSITSVLANFLRMPYNVTPAPISEGRNNELSLFEDLTGERLSLPSDHPHARRDLVQQDKMDGRRLRLLQHILEIYRIVLPWLLGSALAVFLATLFLRPGNAFLLVLNLALLGGLVARLALVAYMDLTCHPAATPFYLSPAYAVALPFSILSWYSFSTAVRHLLRRRHAAI